MKFTHQMTYDASPADVHAMLVDPAFRAKVCTAMHATQQSVRVEPADPGVTVVVDQTQPARRIPSFAQKVVGDEIRIVQRERWTSTDRASLALEIPGKPGTMDGDITLVPAGSGTTETVTGDVRVKVPFVGGRLEGLVADLLEAAMRTEERVGRAWLSGQR
jgi:Protein of unknown function (DUF2505)